MSVGGEGPQRIMVVGEAGDELGRDLAWVHAAAVQADEGGWSVEPADEMKAMAAIAAGTVDLIVCICDTAPGASAFATLRPLRSMSTSIPIVCLLAASDDESMILKALRAGAHECLIRHDRDAQQLARALRFAFARGRYQQRADERRDAAAREREIGGLSAISGLVPLPITGRSFGLTALAERHPTEHARLVEQYSALLGLALEERSVKVESRLGEELNTLADRLGLLGAGPRDIIDLHRSALTGCLEGQSIRRARAYVEVGRLLLLQIMGFLASFYRHLSWGSAHASRSTFARDTMVATGAMTTGKDSI